MADMPWEHADEARAALNAIVTDPEHGVAALSSPRTMSNLLKDLLPDAPREKNLLIAAAEAGVPDALRDHVSQGMDSNTAVRLTASSFSATTPLTPDACSGVTGEIAVALGISDQNDAVLGSELQPGAGASGPSAAARPGAAEFSPGYDRASAAQESGWPEAGRSPTGQDSYARMRNSAPAAAEGVVAGSAVVSPGQAEPSSYAQPGFGQPSPTTPLESPGQAWSGQAPGYVPPIGSWPAQNPQAYGPGVTAGMPFMPGSAMSPGYQPLPQPGIRPRTNPLAITSLVLGIVQFVGWFLILLPGLLAAILAIVLGFVSMQQTRRAGEAGRGLAIAGIVLGFLGIIVVGILVIAGVASMNSQG
jgi:Domain of unknown function (DUF4190)